jgi:hypothetical protein
MANTQIVTDSISKSIPLILGALSGASITAWFNRSQIWIGLKSVKRCDSHLVKIEPELIDLINQVWGQHSIKESQITIKKLEEYRDKNKSGLEKNREAYKILSEALNKLSSNLDNNREKCQLIALLLNNEYCRNILHEFTLDSYFCFSDETLSIIKNIENENEEVIYIECFIDPNNSLAKTKKGFVIKNENPRINYKFYSPIEFTDKKTLNDINVVCKILQYFIQPGIKDIFESIKQHTNKQIEILEQIENKLKDKIKKSHNFIIEAHISNLGGKPEQIDSYGLLEIKSGGDKIDPIKVCIQNYKPFEAGIEDISRLVKINEQFINQQTNGALEIPPISNNSPIYAVINPHQSVSIELESIDTIKDERIITWLEQGVLSSQLHMRRSNKNLFNRIKWFSSQELIMGTILNDDRKKELNDYSNKLKK